MGTLEKVSIHSTLKPVGIHQDSTESDETQKRKNPPKGGFFGDLKGCKNHL
ncbi:hypothetical protein ALQ94_200002 [Pseudomonas amygdali pv. morsprunorum]|uniref:Uncharacterized protein n=1 Tax=Pseudomonas amygdali pv. morsprunorum TaxID=129138 RepID=A0A3M2X2U1_PSEA0|nr:hypothetical protein ALQ94_200002 [Pseudomonas amygdali pv. morsprunorum]